MSLDIGARDVKGIAVLDLDGRLVAGPEATSLAERVKQLVAGKKNRFLLNLQKVSYIDSTGAGSLVRCFSLAKSVGGDLKLAKPNEHFREVLRLTQLVKILEVYGNESEALASFR